MKKMEFTKKDSAEATGVKPRTIQFHTDEGLLIPEVYNPSGRGTTRKYSRKNLLEILLIQLLAGNGFSLKQIKALFEHARAKGVDRKWDPEGSWGHMDANKKAKLVVANGHSGEPQIMVLGSEFYRLNWDKYDSAFVVNIENLFIKVDAVE